MSGQFPVAVLAGGLASRLGPLSAGVPKILMDIDGRPFAEHQIELFRQQGVREVVYCVGHLGEQVEQALGDGRRWGMSFRYVHDGPRLMGTGGALMRALPLLGAAFFVIYGDSYLECEFAPAAAAFLKSSRPALMTVFRNDGRWDRSNVLYDGARILRYDKAAHDSEMHYIDYGLGVLAPAAFGQWRTHEGPLDLANVYKYLASIGQLAGYEVSERFYEIGSVAGLEETRARVAARRRSLS